MPITDQIKKKSEQNRFIYNNPKGDPEWLADLMIYSLHNEMPWFLEALRWVACCVAILLVTLFLPLLLLLVFGS